MHLNLTQVTKETAKRLSTMRETQVRSLGWEDPQEVGTATHSSTLAWKIPWTEEPGGLGPMGLQSRTRLKRLSIHAHHMTNG